MYSSPTQSDMTSYGIGKNGMLYCRRSHQLVVPAYPLRCQALQQRLPEYYGFVRIHREKRPLQPEKPSNPVTALSVPFVIIQ